MTSTRRAVFFDRDGVICKEKSYITSVEQLEIFPFAVDAVKMLKDAGWLCIVVTNQSAVARGMMTEEELSKIHDSIYGLMPVDRIYYCPHHPNEGKEGTSYNIECGCRKPEPGMILQAAMDFNIDLRQSFMVGDRATDLIAGQRSGTKTVLVKTGYDISNTDVIPDYVFSDIKEFADFVTQKGCNFSNVSNRK